MIKIIVLIIGVAFSISASAQMNKVSVTLQRTNKLDTSIHMTAVTSSTKQSAVTTNGNKPILQQQQVLLQRTTTLDTSKHMTAITGVVSEPIDKKK